MRYRHGVSGFLILLFAITYIDRVCKHGWRHAEASQVGGAIAPLLVVPIQSRYADL